MKEPTQLVDTFHHTSQPLNPKNGFMNEIDSRKRTISQIKAKHEQKLKNAQLQLKQQLAQNKSKPNTVSKVAAYIEQYASKFVDQTTKDTKNPNISDTDKLLFQKKFKNFLNHRQEFQQKAKQRRQQIMQERKNMEAENTLNQEQDDEYVDKEELMKDTQGENQFKNAEEMIAFYEEITFGKKNKKKDVHLYHAEKIEYLFRREEFDFLIELQTGQNSGDHQHQLPTLVTSVKKETVLNYLFDEPAVMMLYSINPYLLGDELAEFETSNNDEINFEEFSNFLLIDREPTYFEYSPENLDEARKLGRGIKCQPIISKWIGDQETYDWLIELFRKVDIIGEEQADREVLTKKIRKEAEKERLLDEEIIEIVNIDKLITLDRILYEIQYSKSESSKISLEQFEGLLKHYQRLQTPEKDKLITKLILAGKYDPSYIFILGNQPIQIIKETFNSIQKLAGYFVPKEKFVQKLVKNPKFNKIRNIPVRSEGNRYVKKQTIEQTLARFLNEAETFVDIEEVTQFFTNRGRPRKVQHQIYLANLQIQIARIEEEERRKQQKKLSEGDYSTSSDEEEFQNSIKQKVIQRKKDKLASIRASQKFTEGKKFNVTVPNAFSFGDGTKDKKKVSIREKKLKQQLDQKRRLQDEAMKPIPPKSVPQHVKEDLYQKIMREQERERKERLERFRIEIQQSMYPISPHLLSKPKSKSIYEQPKDEYRFIAKPLPWYCEVNLLERIEKQKDERRQRILEEIINKHSEYDLPEGVKKMFEREAKSKSKIERMRAESQTTANAGSFIPKITSSVPDFQMIHEHLQIDLENRKQEKKPIQVVPFSFENRPHRSRTAMEPQQNQSLNKLKQSKQSQIHKGESAQINIPITEKHLALMNLRRKQQEQKIKKLEEEKRASTVRKMRQQKFAPYVREVLRKSRMGEAANSRAIIESKIQEFKKEERKRKRQYQEEMIKIYTKVFNRPLLVEGEGEKRDSNDGGEERNHDDHQKARNLETRSGPRKHNDRENMEHYAEDYEMQQSNPTDQYSRRNPQDNYDDMRRKAIEHPPRNYLLEEPNGEGQGHDQQEDEFEGEYLSENGRYTN